ncbi:cell surface glycoprotein 1-like isoform X2 [Thrips palmi]|uniref:Cell surface glycoprotein 1-like isoform X2 n=1 Tax=Thrips palmi TaxID=161013 RepID=A0A6P8ZV27_THRPL|nr:cell surface glycoprotein 1-like isoform X2 [Thrips palmi]
MVRTTALLASLAVLLGCCALAAGADDCGDWSFTCGNGECVDVGARCDGRPDCSDGSDEASGACLVNAVALALDYQAYLTFSFDEDYVAVWVLSCSETACSRVYVDGFDSQGRLSYAAGNKCNAKGFDCTTESSHTPANSNELQSGDYTLVAERQSAKLYVWLQGHPDKPIAVSIDESQTQVRVRPDLWKNNMRVKISVIPAVIPATTEAPSTSENPATSPAASPSDEPATSPAASPSDEPATSPAASPSDEPATSPAASPSDEPATSPAASPSDEPATSPAASPSDDPATTPAASPSVEPATSPAASPSDEPATSPAASPSDEPATTPAASPSVEPATSPAASPSEEPVTTPAASPSDESVTTPSASPSDEPATTPEASPSDEPVTTPVVSPSDEPATTPNVSPSEEPATTPVVSPSEGPVTTPEVSPSDEPATTPEVSPSDGPATTPDVSPSEEPATTPDVSPTEEPATPTQESTTEEATTATAAPTPAPWPPRPVPTSCTPEMASLFIPVPGQCGSYLWCYSGRSALMRCPSTLRFSYQQQTCDWPRNVECPATLKRSLRAEGTTADDSATTPEELRTTDDSTTSEESTQTDSTAENETTWSDVSTTEDSNSTTEVTVVPAPVWPPVPAPTSCTGDLESLLIPVAGDCRKYEACYSGRSKVRPCPSILLFNYQLQTCDWPRNVICEQ